MQRLSLRSDVRVKTCLQAALLLLTRVWSSCCALQLLLARRLNMPPPSEYLWCLCFLAAFEQNTKHLTQRSLFLLTPRSQRMQNRLEQTFNKSQTAERSSCPPENLSYVSGQRDSGFVSAGLRAGLSVPTDLLKLLMSSQLSEPAKTV